MGGIPHQIPKSLDSLNTNKYITFDVDFYCCEQQVCQDQFDYFTKCLNQAYPKANLKQLLILTMTECEFKIVDQQRQIDHKFEIIVRHNQQSLKVNDRTEISEFNVTLLIKRIQDFVEQGDE